MKRPGSGAPAAEAPRSRDAGASAPPRGHGISVVILTLNEEASLPRCLESVAWSDDVLVVDSFSTDRTVAIAREAGARVLQRRFDHFAGQRNFALSEGGLAHDWVLHLDADEVVTAALREELFRVVRDAEFDAFRVASRLIFRGRWLRHASLYPAYQVRLGRRDRLRFAQVGHGQREVLEPERIGTLREPLVHYSFAKGLADWFEKHNRYSTAEAHRIVREGRPSIPRGRDLLRTLGSAAGRRRLLRDLSFRLPGRPLLRFAYAYLWRRGFLDGRAGFTYCMLMAWYEYAIDLKVDELRRRDAGLEP